MSLGSGIRDPGSGINPFRIPDPGVKKAPDPDPQHGLLPVYRIRIRFQVKCKIRIRPEANADLAH
jgi:hypothetical protein